MMKNNKSQKNISDEWQCAKLGDFLDKVEGGGTPSKLRSDFWNGLIPWASVKDVVTHNPNNTQDHITELGLKNSSSRLVSKRTLIVPTRMALGHAVFFDVDVAINQDLKALYPKKELQNKFLFYWFESKKEFIKRLGSGSTVDGIQQNELKAIKFNLPSLPEQSRIIAVLETWDHAIEKLAKKIQIKKNVKKGLMQNLLTGKVRLVGFSDKWLSFEFSDCFYVRSKIKGEKKQNYLKEGLFPIIDQSRSKIAGYSNDQSLVVKTNLPFIIFGDHTRILKLAEFPFILGNDGTKVFQGKNGYDTKFLFYLLSGISVPNTGYNRHFKFLKDLVLEIPKSEEEQAAIARIITTDDDEIKKLEKKLTILKDQKKYLLNNLITGTIRTKA